MRISSTACYALHLLICLAEQQHLQQPVSASELSQQTGISEKFTQKILRLLSGAGIVRSVRGIAGGHLLSIPRESINLASIIRAVEGGITPPVAQDGSGPGGLRACDTWEKAAHSLERSLECFTLQNVMDSTSSLNPECAQCDDGPSNTGVYEASSHTSVSGVYHAKARSLGRQRSRKRRRSIQNTSTT